MPTWEGGGDGRANTAAAPQRTQLIVTDGVHTITNATTIQFGAGVAVADGGSGVALVTEQWRAGTVATLGAGLTLTSGTLSASGGGGSAIAGGLGAYAVTAGGTITIGNTGTIIQPAETGTNDGLGIVLMPGAPGPGGTLAGGVQIYGPNITGAGAGGLVGTAFSIYTGDVTITSPTGYGSTGQIFMASGKVTNGIGLATGASVIFGSGSVYKDQTSYGGNITFGAGYSRGSATLNNGGSVIFNAGDGIQSGGDIVLSPAAGGAQNGALKIGGAGLPTIAGTAGVVFRAGTTSTGGGFALYISP